MALLNIIVECPDEYIPKILQALRDIEQYAPEKIHLRIRAETNDMETDEMVKILRLIVPSLPHTVVIPIREKEKSNEKENGSNT